MSQSLILEVVIKPLMVTIIGILLYIFDQKDICIIVLFMYLIDCVLRLRKDRLEEREKDSFTNFIKDRVESEVNNFVIPVVVTDNQGKIVWCNERFMAIKREEQYVGNNIMTLVRGINIDMSMDESEIYQVIKIANIPYKVTRLRASTSENILFYFNDISELLIEDDRLEDIVLIEVDNFTEVLDNTDENNRPLLAAEIERTINSYAHDMKAMIKKFDSNKYILSVQDKYIKEQIEDKFPILDKITKIQKGNKLEPTISIGVGRKGLSPMENNNFAIGAKELALGRGGNQAVIKSYDDIKFFGGNGNELEKRTRVRARIASEALNELIAESNKVYIMGHRTPDMDCFGSAIALSSIIKQLGKDCKIIIDKDIKPIEVFYNRLKKEEQYKDRFISLERAKETIDNSVLLIILDVHNKSYVADLDLVNQTERRVIIDHHRRSTQMIEGNLLNYIEVYASSTSEMITEMIQYMLDNPKLSKIDAEGLLAGIYMDTKGFSFKTGVRTFEAASFLRNAGADTIEIKKMFTDNLSDYLLIADTIRTAKTYKNPHTAIAICPNDVDTVIIAKAADELLNISGMLVSFVLAKRGDDIYISGRSVGDINIQVVLEELGGGGHMNIAGTKIPECSVDNAIKQLEKSIDKNLKVGE